MRQAVIQRRLTISDAISGYVHGEEPDPHKGVGDWDAFSALISEDWTYAMIAYLPSEIEDVPVAKETGLYHRFSQRFLTSSVFGAATSTDPNVASVEENFAALADRWHGETDLLSSPSRITGNDTYLEIISMGKRVIPLILEDLKERGGEWYRALRILSGEDPVRPEAKGHVGEMKKAWLQWGRERGYIV